MKKKKIAQKIFIAFTGPKIKQRNKIYKIARRYECWNLSKFKFNDFISTVKRQIPPVNKNVLGNYEIDCSDKRKLFGITDKEYKKCSWGLLLPDDVPGSLVGGYGEILFLLNLYSSHFLYPVFYVSNFGILPMEHHKNQILYFHGQNQAEIFKQKRFVKFFKALLSESVYAVWQADRCAKWNEEDWRMFVACFLFSGLKTYENSKVTLMWQRESADMITILEALFTAKDENNTEILYRLRKRVNTLVGFRFNNIDLEIKELYKQRSAFVHGSLFTQIKKWSKVRNGYADLPLPDLHFLKRQKEHVRFSLNAYLYLNKIYKSKENEFKECKNVLEILEESIIDIGLRNRVKKHVKKILSYF